MLYNYLIVAFRNLRKQPGFTAIKVLSLSLGLVCSILVLMHVQYTRSYDKHFDNWQNIYRVVTSLTIDQRFHTAMLPDAIYSPLLQDYGQIELAARIRPGNGLFSHDDVAATNSYLWVDPEFLQIFSFDFIQGNADTALSEPNTIVLNQSTAAKYFGQEDPLGKVLTLENRTDLSVTGVIKDLPPNTHLNIEAMIGVPTGRQISGESFMNNPMWFSLTGMMAYIVISDRESADAIRADFTNFIERNVPDDQRESVTNVDVELDLEPLANIHLLPRQGLFASPDRSSLVLPGLVTFAALILLSSCINFANLSLSQMQQRGKETGVRKALGATQSDLLAQFLLESMMLTLLALLVALPVIYVAIGPYTTLTSTGFTFGAMFGSSQVFIIVLFVLVTGLLSGLIPALRMSQIAPTAVIIGKRDGGRSSHLIHSGLTLIQFSFAVALVVLALAITLQVRHLNELDIGFNRSNLVVLDTRYSPRTPIPSNYNAMINELRQHPGILTVGKSDGPPLNNGAFSTWSHANRPTGELRILGALGVDENYVNVMKLQLLAGRNFSRDYPADFIPQGSPDQEQTYSVLITPAAVSFLDLGSNEAAIDQILIGGGLRFRVIGVINDFRLSGGLEDTLRSTTILRATTTPPRTLLIRIDPAQQASALNHIDAVWADHQPATPINREFYEQIFNQRIYEQTNGINRAAQFAALITFAIAALGLYALAFYSTERRTKEIGVRKVFGASTRSIVALLSVDFIKPVLLACALASGLAYIVTAYFFAQFSAQATLSPHIYLLVIAGTVLLSLFTVAAQCIKTANANPVTSLRSE